MSDDVTMAGASAASADDDNEAQRRWNRMEHLRATADQIRADEASGRLSAEDAVAAHLASLQTIPPDLMQFVIDQAQLAIDQQIEPLLDYPGTAPTPYLYGIMPEGESIVTTRLARYPTLDYAKHMYDLLEPMMKLRQFVRGEPGRLVVVENETGKIVYPPQ